MRLYKDVCEMKKLLSFCAVLTAVLCLFASCNNGAANSDETPAPEATEDPVELNAALAIYKTPVEMFDLGLNGEDISTDDIEFTYADDGRILNCSYQIENKNIFISYNYNDDMGTVHLLGFMDTIVIVDQTFTYSVYVKDLGFSAHQGYYFRGLNFENQIG